MRVLSACCGLMCLATVAGAQEVTTQITMTPGFYALWKSPRPFTEVLIADPLVVDGAPARDSSTLRFIAKAPGATNVIVLDEQDEPIANIVVVVSPREIAKVVIHNKLGNLAGYTAYQCTPICTRLEDKFEGQDRIPVPTAPQQTVIVNTNK